MKYSSSLFAALLTLLPLTFAFPIANPATCSAKSVNGVTTHSGDCGGNQQASGSSSDPGSSGSTNNGASTDLSNMSTGGDAGSINAGTGDLSSVEAIEDKVDSIISNIGADGGRK